MYHTQEKRAERLTVPIICDKDNAWLGVAYYFWYEEDDASFWGIISKRRTGYFEIYKAEVDCSNILDTVFNEEHYLFWKAQINKAQKAFAKSGVSPSLKQLNDYFLGKGIWQRFGGIMFQDISNNPNNYFVKEFQYKKRIQLAAYNLNIINNFAYHYTGKCV